MDCPHCGDKLRIRDTRTFGETTIRIYKCQVCNLRFVSQEKLGKKEIKSHNNIQYSILVVLNDIVKSDMLFIFSYLFPSCVKFHARKTSENVSDSSYNLYIYIDEPEEKKSKHKLRHRFYLNSSPCLFLDMKEIIFKKLIEDKVLEVGSEKIL